MTLTPERLAELRAACRRLDHDGLILLDATEIVADRDEMLELVQAADNIAALLAAAERAEVEWAFTLGELVKHTDPLEHKMRCEDHDVFRAAIRRAKGEP